LIDGNRVDASVETMLGFKDIIASNDGKLVNSMLLYGVGVLLEAKVGATLLNKEGQEL
jgi:hypothetical protein